MKEQFAPARRRPPGRGKWAAVAVGTLIAAPLLLTSTACGAKDSDPHAGSTAAATPSHTPATHMSAPPGPAQRLADLDGDYRAADQYQQVLSALAPRCKEDPSHLATVVDTTQKALKHKGGTDDEFGVLQKLEAWVPAGRPRADCASEATAYAAQANGS
ncbi:hypothetical protein ACIQI8_21960 [Streptomyces sp. NPDC092369]|uniref:hypothetical protein n=1 Tax=Streptomyces sp. NPDC092369 TaxID=3366015 RepID=UPI00380295FE